VPLFLAPQPAEVGAALGRIADTDEAAVRALEKRAPTDVSAYIAAWSAVTRGAPWGSTLVRSALADPTRRAILELLTPPKPKADPAAAGKPAGGIEVLGKVVAEQDPQAQLVASYRRKLSMALN
jgi:hypothetical protein